MTASRIKWRGIFFSPVEGCLRCMGWPKENTGFCYYNLFDWTIQTREVI